MKRNFIVIIVSVLSIIYSDSFSQSCCGGSIYDVAVLPLNKKALFNVGFNYENYMGVWNELGVWNKIANTSYQMKPVMSAGYRFNKQLQAGLSFPFVYNRNELPGLRPSGSGIGDITISGRYEFLHEFQVYELNGKNKTEKKTPYLAMTFGLVLPTGKSDESALTEAEITGKGAFATTIGVSALKSIIRNKFQTAIDLSWQHNFEKTYTSVYGEPVTNSFTKKLGDKFNYGLSFNYLINDWNAVSLSAGGFLQSAYKIDGTEGHNSDEHVLNFTTSYTYYPNLNIRITPSFKWYIPTNNIGKNTTGSYLFALNLVYYIENNDDY
jgi:hypothetical protein